MAIRPANLSSPSPSLSFSFDASPSGPGKFDAVSSTSKAPAFSASSEFKIDDRPDAPRFSSSLPPSFSPTSFADAKFSGTTVAPELKFDSPASSAPGLPSFFAPKFPPAGLALSSSPSPSPLSGSGESTLSAQLAARTSRDLAAQDNLVAWKIPSLQDLKNGAQQAGDMFNNSVIKPAQRAVENNVIKPVQRAVEPVRNAIEQNVVKPVQRAVENNVIKPVQRAVEQNIIRPAQHTYDNYIKPIVQPRATQSSSPASRAYSQPSIGVVPQQQPQPTAKLTIGGGKAVQIQRPAGEPVVVQAAGRTLTFKAGTSNEAIARSGIVREALGLPKFQPAKPPASTQPTLQPQPNLLQQFARDPLGTAGKVLSNGGQSLVNGFRDGASQTRNTASLALEKLQGNDYAYMSVPPPTVRGGGDGKVNGLAYGIGQIAGNSPEILGNIASFGGLNLLTGNDRQAQQDLAADKPITPQKYQINTAIDTAVNFVPVGRATSLVGKAAGVVGTQLTAETVRSVATGDNRSALEIGKSAITNAGVDLLFDGASSLKLPQGRSSAPLAVGVQGSTGQRPTPQVDLQATQPLRIQSQPSGSSGNNDPQTPRVTTPPSSTYSMPGSRLSSRRDDIRPNPVPLPTSNVPKALPGARSTTVRGVELGSGQTPGRKVDRVVDEYPTVAGRSTASTPVLNLYAAELKRTNPLTYGSTPAGQLADTLATDGRLIVRARTADEPNVLISPQQAAQGVKVSPQLVNQSGFASVQQRGTVDTIKDALSPTNDLPTNIPAGGYLAVKGASQLSQQVRADRIQPQQTARSSADAVNQLNRATQANAALLGGTSSTLPSNGFSIVIPTDALRPNAQAYTPGQARSYENLSAQDLFDVTAQVRPERREGVINASGLSRILEVTAKGDDDFLAFKYPDVSQPAYIKPANEFDAFSLPPTPIVQTVKDPQPIVQGGRRYDIVGTNPRDNSLQLRASTEMDRLVPRRELLPRQVNDVQVPGRTVSFEDRAYELRDIQSRSDAANGLTLRPLGSTDARNDVFVPSYRLNDVTMQLGSSNTYKAAGMTGSLMHLQPVGKTMPTFKLQEGTRFEAFVKHAESGGPVELQFGKNQLTVTRSDNPVLPTGTQVDLDAVQPSRAGVMTSQHMGFADMILPDRLFQPGPQVERKLSSVLTDVNRGAPGAKKLGAVDTDPLIGRNFTTVQNQADFINNYRDPVAPKSLTMQNINYDPAGVDHSYGRDGRALMDALVDFRQRYPQTEMVLFGGKGSALNFTEKRGTTGQFLSSLNDNDIELRLQQGTTRETTTHAKSINISANPGGAHSAAITSGMAGLAKDKSEFIFPLKGDDAKLFNEYVSVITRPDPHGSRGERTALATQLAERGIMVQDTYAKQPVIRQTINELAAGSKSSLLALFNAARMPDMTDKFIDAARRGVDVTLQLREVDTLSLDKLRQAQAQLPNLRFEVVPDPPGYPHYNAVIADGKDAYVGTGYPWPAMLNTSSPTQLSSEVGVKLRGENVRKLLEQIGQNQQYTGATTWGKASEAERRARDPATPINVEGFTIRRTPDGGGTDRRSTSDTQGADARANASGASGGGLAGDNLGIDLRRPVQALNLLEQRANATTAGILASRSIDAQPGPKNPPSVPLGQIGLRDASFVAGARTVPNGGSNLDALRGPSQDVPGTPLHTANVSASNADAQNGTRQRMPQALRPAVDLIAPVMKPLVESTVRSGQQAAMHLTTATTLAAGNLPATTAATRLPTAGIGDASRINGAPTSVSPGTTGNDVQPRTRLTMPGSGVEAGSLFADPGLQRQTQSQIMRALSGHTQPLEQLSGTVGAGLNLARTAAEPIVRPVTQAVTRGGPAIASVTLGSLGLGQLTGHLRTGSFTMNAPKGAEQQLIATMANMPPNAKINYAVVGDPAKLHAMALTSHNQAGYFVPRATGFGQTGVPPQPIIGNTGAGVRTSDASGFGQATAVFQTGYGSDLRATANYSLTGARTENYTQFGVQVPPKGKAGVPYIQPFGLQGGPGSAVAAANLFVGPNRFGYADLVTLGNMDVSVGTQGAKLSTGPFAVRSLPGYGINLSFGASEKALQQRNQPAAGDSQR